MTPKPGYAAGNILNLLVHLGADLTGYDVSGLSMWQAFLRDARLYNAQFAHTDIRGARFAEKPGTFYSAAFSPDGTVLVAGTIKNSGGCHIREAGMDGRG